MPIYWSPSVESKAFLRGRDFASFTRQKKFLSIPWSRCSFQRLDHRRSPGRRQNGEDQACTRTVSLKCPQRLEPIRLFFRQSVYGPGLLPPGPFFHESDHSEKRFHPKSNVFLLRGDDLKDGPKELVISVHFNDHLDKLAWPLPQKKWDEFVLDQNMTGT